MGIPEIKIEFNLLSWTFIVLIFFGIKDKYHEYYADPETSMVIRKHLQNFRLVLKFAKNNKFIMVKILSQW